MRRLLASHPVPLSLALVALVFAVDLCLPLGVASAVPYTFAVLLALSARSAWFGPSVAVLCMVLTVAKMELVPERGSTEMWKVIVNRCLALFAIGMTTLLGLLRRQAAAERQRAEERLREHQADLAHMSRLSMLGQVTAALAHELNQPLAAVCLQADIGARLAVPGGTVREELTAALGEISEQSRRAADIVASIRRMARRTDPGSDPVDLNEVVRVVARLLDWQARRADVAIEQQLDIAGGTTFGDQIQIEQVLFNLVQNAIEAVVARGEGPRLVTIETRRGADTMTLSVRDTGIGITNPEQAFERFYTTKPTGLGLGLAISKGIVEAHGGKIWAESAEGGAMFAFTLPLANIEETR